MATSLGALPAPDARSQATVRPASRLLFAVGPSRLALECRVVVEVVRRVPLQRAVGAPPALAGFFDHRGTLIPVVDLHALLLGPPCPADRAARIAVVELQAHRRFRRVGLLAEGFTRLMAGDAPVQDALQVPDRPYLAGWVRDGASSVQRVVAESLLGEAWLEMLIGAPDEGDAASVVRGTAQIADVEAPGC